MLFIAIGGTGADKDPGPLPGIQGGPHLPGDVPGVQVVDHRPEGGQVVLARSGVDVVPQGDVPHSFFREVPFQVVAGEDVVPPQPGQVFGEDGVQQAFFDVPQHLLKAGAVEG